MQETKARNKNLLFVFCILLIIENLGGMIDFLNTWKLKLY